MATTDAKVTLEVDVLSNKKEFDQLIQSLQRVQGLGSGDGLAKNLSDASDAARDLEKILNKSWDSQLNQLNLTQLNTELKNAGISAADFYNKLANGGKAGVDSANKLISTITHANTSLKQTSQLLDRMATTFKNTIRYGISSSVFNTFTNSIRDAYNYTKQLDTSLNDIRIVSGKSADEMAELAVQANKAAQALGKTTLDYTKAATIFYQQGLPTADVERRTEVVLKAANVTGQSAQEVSEQLTAVWNGYQVANDELELYVDKLSAVAASSASNLEELSTGMSKVASAANVMGVDIDQLTAQMSTIISVTRQAPESVGTALRTIYARIADIKAGIDGETTLGNYSGKMKKLGFDVLDASGNLKEMGDVIEEIGGKWETLTREQQVSLAQTMAGTRQYNNLLTLFDNWDKYTKALNTSQTAAGKLQEQQDIYMESTEAHLKQMRAEAEELYATLIDQDGVRVFIDLINGALKSVNSYITTLGGGFNTVLNLGAQIANLFSTQISAGLSRQIQNWQARKEEVSKDEMMQDLLEAHHKEGEFTDENSKSASKNNALSQELDLYEKIFKVRKNLSKEEYDEAVELTKEFGSLQAKIDEMEPKVKELLAKRDVLKNNLGDRLQQYGLEEEEDLSTEDKLTAAQDIIERQIAARQQEVDTEEKEDEVLKQLIEDLETINELKGISKDKTMEEYDALQSEANNKKGKAGKLEKLGDQRDKVKEAVKVTTAVTQALTIWAGAIKTFGDETASTEQKVSAGYNAVVGSLAAAANIALPGSGILVQMAGSLLDTVGITKALTNLFKSDSEKMQEEIDAAAKSAENLGKEADELKGKADNLKASFDKYTEIKGILNQCTEGSKQWNEALEELNDTVLQLLRDMPELANITGLITRDANGMLAINEQLYKEQIQKVKNAEIVARLGALQADNTKTQLENKKARKDFRDNYKIKVNASRGESVGYTAENYERNYLKDSKSFDLSDADLQRLIDASGSPDEFKKVVNTLSETYKDEILSSLRKSYGKNVKLEDIDLTKWTEGLIEDRDKFVKHQQSVKENNQSIANQNRVAATIALGNNATNTEIALYDSLQRKTLAGNRSTIKQEMNDRFTRTENVTQSDIDYLNKGQKGRYSLALDVDNTVLGDDGDNGIIVYDNYLGYNVQKTNDEFTNELANIKTLNDMDTDKVVEEAAAMSKRLSTKSGLTEKEIDQILNPDFDVNSLDSAEEVERLKGKIGNLKKAIEEEGLGKEVTEALNDNIDASFADNYDTEKHEEYLKNKFSSDIAQSAAGAESVFGLDKDEFEGYAKYIAEISTESDKLANSLEKDGEAASVVTRSVMRMNKGVESLAKGFEDWNDVLTTSTKESKEYYDALDGVRDSVSDILDVEKDAVSNDFIEEHLNEIKEAATGNEEAIEALRDAYADSVLLNILVNNELDEDKQKLLVDQLNQLQTKIPDIKIGATLDTEKMGESEKDFLQACQNIIQDSKMTAEQAKEFFASMGFEANFETKKVPMQRQGYKTITETEITDMATVYTPDGGTYTYPSRSVTSTTQGDPYDYTEYVEVPSLSTDENGKPQFKITKKADGGMNNFSSANKGGGSPGGKSGSGGSNAKPSQKDPNKDELDRYQLVNVQLKEISKELTKLDKEKNKLLGGKLLANLNNQIKLLNDQITVTEAKLKIAKDEQSEVASKLAGYGIKFDSQGNIANYAQIFKQEQAKLNAVYDAFNGMSKDAQESYQDTVKAAEETWKTFKDSISKYDNLIGETIPQLYQDIRDAFDKQTEMFIQEFNMEVKLRLDMSSAMRDWNEFRRKVIDGIKDDDILGTAKAKLVDFESYYNAAGKAEIQALTKQLQGQLEELRKQDATGSAEWYRDNRAKAIEDLKDNYDKIRNSLTEIIKLEEEMQQKVLDMMDQAQDKFDEQIGTFENINKHLEHNIQLINLLTDENDYAELSKQYAAQTKNREQELDFYTKQRDYWENYLKTLEEGSKEWDEAKAKYNEAAEAWASALETTIEAARKEFENNIKLIFQTINNQLTDNKGLEYLNEQWELLSDNSNMVLDNINKMQKFQDLTKKYNDAINSTSNIAAQKKLAQLRDQELAALKGIDNLNEKDLERAEKKLDIIKAQIALEDAQRNKTQMRLRRDSQGNYRYQFVADEEEVQRAQQDLASAYNELYNFDKERYKSNLNDAYAAWNDYQEKMAEAALINDPEVRGEREALLTKEYNERILILTEENERIKQELNESTIAELNSLYAQNADNYELMTEEQKAALNDFNAANQTAFDLVFDLYTENTEKFRNMTQDQLDIIENQMVPQWTSGYQTLIDKIEGEGGIEDVSADLAEQLHNEADSYKQDLGDIEVAAGQTFGEISDSQNDIIQNTKDMLEANDGLISEYTEMTNAVMDQYSALKDLMNEYEQAAKDAKQAAEDAYNYIMREKEDEAKAAAENVDNGPTTGGTGNYNPAPEPAPVTPAPVAVENTVPSTPFTAVIPQGTNLYDIDGNKYRYGTKADRTVTVQDTSGELWRVWGSTFNPNVVYVNRHALGYDTGGYTGDWGNDGRLAFLHQKELVLNKEDTANMLNAVEILRGITANIGADILGKLASASAISMNGAIGNNTLDQNVHIEATFPGVTSSIEIQDALNNLVNMASQKVLQR